MRKTPVTYAKELHAALMSTGREMRPPAIGSFLADLSRARKSNLRHRILAEFTRLALAVEGRRAGSVTTARAIDNATREKIAGKFSDVVFVEKINTDIVAGAILEIEDTRYDGSVRSALNDLKNILSRNSK